MKSVIVGQVQAIKWAHGNGEEKAAASKGFMDGHQRNTGLTGKKFMGSAPKVPAIRALQNNLAFLTPRWVRFLEITHD